MTWDVGLWTYMGVTSTPMVGDATSVELFTGGGGLALGAHQAGFRHLLLVEVDPVACETIRRNNQRGVVQPNWPLVEANVHGLDLTPWQGKVDLLAAGAPCQPFSLGGLHRGDGDSRNLFPEALRAVREIRPKAVIFENVRGLTRPSFFPYFEYVMWQLERPDLTTGPDEDWREHKARLEKTRKRGEPEYLVKHRVLNAADYGVPQHRSRVLMVAVQRGLGVEWDFPERTHSSEALLYSKWVEKSYWYEHELPERDVPDVLGLRVKLLKDLGKPLPERHRTVRDALAGLPEPVEGEEHSGFLNHVGIPGARRYKGHEGSPMDEPAKTLKAGVHGVPGGEGTVLRDDGTVRYFSVREAARIQTFPDEYYFHGSRTRAMRADRKRGTCAASGGRRCRSPAPPQPVAARHPTHPRGRP